MLIKELSTGCGDLLLTSFYPTDENGRMLTVKDPGHPNAYWGEGRYLNEKEQLEWLDKYLKKGPKYNGYTAEGRAFVIAILNENQEKTFGHIFEQNDYEIISEGVNAVHNSVLTLRAKVRRTSRIDAWHTQKNGRFSKWFEVIKTAVVPNKVKATNDASGGTGKVLQRKVAVSAPE